MPAPPPDLLSATGRSHDSIPEDREAMPVSDDAGVEEASNQGSSPLDLAYGLEIAAKRGSWHWVLQLYLLVTRDATVASLVQRYAKWGTGGNRLSLEDLRDFWRAEQTPPAEVLGCPTATSSLSRRVLAPCH